MFDEKATDHRSTSGGHNNKGTTKRSERDSEARTRGRPWLFGRGGTLLAQDHAAERESEIYSVWNSIIARSSLAPSQAEEEN